LVLAWDWGGVRLGEAGPGWLEAKLLIRDSNLLQCLHAQKRGLQKLFNNFDSILSFRKDI